MAQKHRTGASADSCIKARKLHYVDSDARPLDKSQTVHNQQAFIDSPADDKRSMLFLEAMDT